MGKKKHNTHRMVQPAESMEALLPPQSASNGGSGGRRRILILFAVMALFAGALIFLRSRSGTSLQAGEFKDYNVLFVTWDTTRADHLPIYGYRRVKAPSLDRLAANSYVFEDAISQAPLTLPSHASMMTGKLPIAHGVRDNTGFFLDPKETTLAEVFKQNGYSTSAFVSAFVLDSRWQLNHGFDLYYDNFNLTQFRDLSLPDVQRRAEETELEFSHWLDEHKEEKFFSWVHFYDPHDPYDPPEPYKTEYAEHLYDGEIAYTDAIFGRLLNKLQELGVRDHTIVVMAGDHGEGLGEHEEATHAMLLYNTTQHVPLVIHLPGAGAKRVKGIVSLIDIAPTLLELAGLPAVNGMQGKTLIPRMNGLEKQARLAYSESIYAQVHYGWSPLESITTDQYKYINAPRSELYDRLHDPGEMTNIIAGKPADAKALEEELQQTIAMYSGKNLPHPQKMDPDAEEALRALGYIGSTTPGTARRPIDPKDEIHLARAIQQAFESLQELQYENALKEIEPVLEEDQQMVDAHFVAGVACLGLGRFDNAVEELLRTLSLRPDHTMAMYDLAYTYELKGDLTEAETWYLKLLQLEPKHLFATLKLAHLYRRWNQPEKARGYFVAAIGPYERMLEAAKDEKARAELYSTLGEIYFGAGNLAKAEQNFQAAIQLTPGRDTLHFNLAQVYEARDKIPEAMDAYRQEIRVDARSLRAYNNLGLLYQNANRLEDAAQCFRKVIELDAKDPRGYMMLSGVYRRMGRNQDAAQVLRLAQQQGIPID